MSVYIFLRMEVVASKLLETYRCCGTAERQIAAMVDLGRGQMGSAPMGPLKILFFF